MTARVAVHVYIHLCIKLVCISVIFISVRIVALFVITFCAHKSQGTAIYELE